ncbi:MAG: DnaJ domain-containing protein, partial [Pseudomonadota bacterium]|nr:DnaJ domain-containing protein [Pseudomonadota bacterium]
EQEQQQRAKADKQQEKEQKQQEKKQQKEDARRAKARAEQSSAEQKAEKARAEQARQEQARQEESRQRQQRSSPPPPDRTTRALAVLGLTPGASKTDVRRAYRRMAQLHHPERFYSDSEHQVALASARFQRIKNAYDYLMQTY